MNPTFCAFPRVTPFACRALIATFALTILLPAAMAQPAVPNAATAIVERPLTPATNDVPDEQPSPQHVWVPGHWKWGQTSYVWIAGRWQLPPVPDATWVAPEWQQQGTGYLLREGYWQQNPPPNDPAFAAQSSKDVTTAQPPPPPQPEAIPEQPSPEYVWQPGYWDWRGNQFAWINGRWELPPRQNLVWVARHWETRGNVYVQTGGYWRENNATAVTAQPPQTVVVTQPQPQPATQVVVMAPPPPPQAEVVYVRPSPNHVWVPGYWAWHGGRYVWVSGHWERPPHGHRVWESPRWERRGGNYIFIDGHWR